MAANHFDVIVVGAGPAGSFLAYSLGKNGIRVAVLETRPKIKRKVCGDYICPPGRNLLIKSGLEHIVQKSRPIKSMLVVTESGLEVDCPFPVNNQGMAISRLVLDQMLIEEAQKVGAQFFFGSPANETEVSENLITVTSQGQKYSGKLLIGADGRTSLVAKAFGLSIKSNLNRVALRTFLNNDSVNPFRAELHLLKNKKYIGIDHVTDQEVSLALVLEREKLAKFESTKECFIETLKTSKGLSQRFLRFSESMQIEASSPLIHQVKQVYENRVALIGDAAGYIDPITGEGNYMALSSANALASELLSTSLNDPSSLNVALRNYASWHERTVKTKLLINSGFQRLIRHPKIVTMIGNHLLGRESRRRAFIEVVGNVRKPIGAIPQLIF